MRTSLSRLYLRKYRFLKKKSGHHLTMLQVFFFFTNPVVSILFYAVVLLEDLKRNMGKNIKKSQLFQFIDLYLRMLVDEATHVIV